MFPLDSLTRFPHALLLAALLGVANPWTPRALGQESGEELARQLPRIGPREPDQALESFALDAGLVIELVAAEPHVIDPVALVFAPDASLFVVEMRDYPFIAEKGNLTNHPDAPEQPPGRIRHLHDDDGDGRVDRSVVFADGLTWPTGVALFREKVIVSTAPDLIALEDTDGDGRADRREVLWTGFGRRNVQALANGLKWGPDNLLYLATSFNGGTITRPSDPSLPGVSIRGRDLRFHPESSELERLPAGGQFGLALDVYGQRYICSNSRHLRQVVIDGSSLDRNPHLSLPDPVVDIAVDGGAAPVFRTSAPEPWRLVRTRWRANSKDASRFPRAELVPVGFFTSATGLTVHEGDGLPERYRGSVFIGDVGGNLVHRKVLDPGDGIVRRARRPAENEKREFLTSTDNWFRPAFLSDGPDGALYICDMYRETIEHPYSIPESIKKHLHLTSGNDRGRIWRVRSTSKTRAARRLDGLAPAELVERLGADDAWTRRQARQLIVQGRHVEIESRLRERLHEASNPEASFDALWALEGLGKLRPADLPVALESDLAPLRQAALRLAARPELRSPPLMEALRGLVSDPDPRTRLRLALTAGALDPIHRLEILTALARRDSGHSWLRTAILASSHGVAAELHRSLFAEESRPEESRLLLVAPLTESVIASGDEAALARLLEGWLPGLVRARPGDRTAATLTLEGLSSRIDESSRGLIGWLESGRPAGLEAGTRQRLVEELGRFLREAAGLATKPDAPLAARRDAVKILARGPSDPAVSTLLALLGPGEPPALQRAALEALARRREANLAGAVLERFTSLGPGLRRAVMDFLFRRPERLDTLLDRVESGEITAADLDPDRREQLRKHPRADLRDRARKLLERVDPDREAVVERYREALTLPGDPARGRVHFEKVCASCHRLGDLGQEVGPDLGTVRGRGREALLVQILDPGREVLPAYLSYRALTRDGQSITGLIASESESHVVLQSPEGKKEAIPRKNLLRLESTGMSLMPAGLEESLSPADVADLLRLLGGS